MWMHLVFFCLRPTYEFETQAHALSSLCCPSFHSDGTCMKGGCFPNVPSNRCSFLCSFHPLSPQLLILLLIFLGNTFACLHRFIPQLWFRRQGCSHSLPALDQVTLPLLSRSPREGAPCQAYWSLPACLLAACLSGPADWRSSTTDAPGQWSRSSYGTDLMENCADERAVGEQG